MEINKTEIKGLMIHYLPVAIDYTEYVKSVKKKIKDFNHLFYPSISKEGVETIYY